MAKRNIFVENFKVKRKSNPMMGKVFKAYAYVIMLWAALIATHTHEPNTTNLHATASLTQL